MQLLLLSLLKYSEMLSQMITFQQSFELLFQLQIELQGNLLDQNFDKLENELSRIQMKQVQVFSQQVRTILVAKYYLSFFHFYFQLPPVPPPPEELRQSRQHLAKVEPNVDKPLTRLPLTPPPQSMSSRQLSSDAGAATSMSLTDKRLATFKHQPSSPDVLIGKSVRIKGISVSKPCVFKLAAHTTQNSQNKWTKISGLETNIFGLKIMVKSGVEFLILKFYQPLQRYLLTCQANSAFLGRFFCTGQQQL